MLIILIHENANSLPCSFKRCCFHLTDFYRFLIKTTDQGGAKVFLNICSSLRVPSPEGWPKIGVPEVVKEYLSHTKSDLRPSDNALAESLLGFPTYISEPKQDVDHSGVPCTVIDVVYSNTVIDCCSIFRPLKIYVCTLSICQAEKHTGTSLERKFKLPKMRSKGKPEPLAPHTHPLMVGRNKRGKSFDFGITEISESRKESGSKSLIPLEDCNIKYEGYPCQQVVLSARIPIGAFIKGEIELEKSYIEFKRGVVRVCVAGCEEWDVKLPITVLPPETISSINTSNKEQSSAIFDPKTQTLRIELKVVSLGKYLKYMRTDLMNTFP